jgi:NAD(P)H-dependent FMN reductase
MPKTRIIGLSGSLRKGSYNSALLRGAAAVAPPDAEITIASLDGIPLYNGDVESREGLPQAVVALKDQIAAAHGLLIVTPEYNNSIPGVLKNTIDWLSRPPKDIARVFGGRPVALIGATPGPGGTRLAQAAWLPVLRTLGMRLWSDKALFVAGAATVFDADGRLVDDKIRERLVEVIAGFARFAGPG